MKMFLAKLAFWVVVTIIAITVLYSLAYIVAAAFAAVVAAWIVIKIITLGDKDE